MGPNPGKKEKVRFHNEATKARDRRSNLSVNEILFSRKRYKTEKDFQASHENSPQVKDSDDNPRQ